ncbi:catalase [Sphingobacterium olei]|uniref:Catalase n=1 Tax=Sphingobacterium olei TaxID=2571155 RepID=A0A4U0NN08_9SPHI|nr:catalase [Sphingobacterium olei]TJZ51424.1 catalase [Sphingobacterium olei]
MKNDITKQNDEGAAPVRRDQGLTSNQGTTIADDFNTLKSGVRGPSLLEDFLFREKIFHFDHERIPERVVHARGAGAHGVFRLMDPIPQFSKAGFLSQVGAETEVFVRFSTVVGSRGSTDLARDVRGFAIKFYTSEGIFDLVGNNIPVFFIQDAINFPDLVHAVKPEERNEIPQAASAHNTFWDFASLMPETAHMVMWLMSDRAIPRSYRMMQGFGVNTYKLLNAQGESFFVKFHLKPKLGVHSVVWDEAQKISGRNPDFHRQDLWEAIENGDYPEWDLGVQILTNEQEQSLDFDILDATKVIPEELIPIQYIGTLQLNRNPDNFFAETEQVAFHPGHLVPGIDFSDDPLLQGRLFSYLDTQLSRLGSPNFHELPINKPKNPTHNFRRDGAMRQDIPKDTGNYNPHSIAGGCPYLSNVMSGGSGFESVPAAAEGRKIRKRSETFGDHFSQASTFYNSQSEIGKKHIQDAFSFELGKVTREEVRFRYLGILSVVDKELATIVADRLGLPVPDGLSEETIQTASQIFENYPALDKIKLGFTYPSLSVEYHCDFDTIKTRKIAAILTEGFDLQELKQMQARIKEEGATLDIIADKYGDIIAATGETVKVDYTLVTMDSVLYDALYVVGGNASQEKLASIKKAVCYVDDALKHNKAIAIGGNSNALVQASDLRLVESDKAIVSIRTADDIEVFIQRIAQHRNWQRELANNLL